MAGNEVTSCINSHSPPPTHTHQCTAICLLSTYNWMGGRCVCVCVRARVFALYLCLVVIPSDSSLTKSEGLLKRTVTYWHKRTHTHTHTHTLVNSQSFRLYNSSDYVLNVCWCLILHLHHIKSPRGNFKPSSPGSVKTAYNVVFDGF